MSNAKQRPIYRPKFCRVIGTDEAGKDKLGRAVEIGAVWARREAGKGRDRSSSTSCPRTSRTASCSSIRSRQKIGGSHDPRHHDQRLGSTPEPAALALSRAVRILSDAARGDPRLPRRRAFRRPDLGTRVRAGRHRQGVRGGRLRGRRHRSRRLRLRRGGSRLPQGRSAAWRSTSSPTRLMAQGSPTGSSGRRWR